MNGGKNCPRCHEDIGTWTIPLGSYINQLSCPHCELGMYYENGLTIILVKFVLVLFGLGLLYWIDHVMEWPLKGIGLGSFLLGWVFMEWFVAQILRETSNLRVRN